MKNELTESMISTYETVCKIPLIKKELIAANAVKDAMEGMGKRTHDDFFDLTDLIKSNLKKEVDKGIHQIENVLKQLKSEKENLG